VGAQPGGGILGAGAGQQRVQRFAAGDLAGQRDRLQRGIVGPAVLTAPINIGTATKR